MAAPRSRVETWGAWVRLDAPPMLVAIDKDGAALLGIDGGTRWSEDAAARAPAPLEAHVAVTARCGAGCSGCYTGATPDGLEPPRDAIVATLDAVARAGAFTVAFGGGEPTTRADLGALADDARARGLSPVLTTSGLGLTPKKLDALARFDQVNVSYDGAAGEYASVRGFDGARAAEAAIAAIARVARVGVNVVLTRATFGALGATLARARALGASEAQLLRYKPAGRAASLDYLAKRLSPAQVDSFAATLREVAGAHEGFGVRVDCALVPFLSTDPSIDAAALERFGVFGCEAAAHLVAVRVDGRVAPCSFAPGSEATAAQMAERWEGPELAPWRAAPEAEPCRSCRLRAVCKGGCKVVARHHGAAGGDPECPRVRAARAAS